MQVLGTLLFMAGAAATAYSVRAVYRRSRPADVVFAVAAPLAALAALTGLLLMFVPDFFG